MVKRDKIKLVYESIMASNSDAISLVTKYPKYKKILLNYLKGSTSLEEDHTFFKNAEMEEMI